ncbi:MAG TPA: DUF4835 family protein [Saprospiraceae bacterium]|nr:DUF4835 family protein [Saprospiraceae bacterium]MCC6687512.1 DUF4835 family protein [Saprospiraceae bacterium]HMV23519.1 DUF4835 family protein [Saprospiraceae bacterium]HMW74009.1 DUF4835 family protein [Saprospiraceae bacterium]HMX81695.1 DUF4835 family protein [Saprospiraceae bacterium]
MSYRNTFLAFIFILLTTTLHSQELLCKVVVNTPKLQTADPKVFQTLQTAIRDFMNNTAWTDVSYDNFEKIDVNITLNITEEVNANTFRGDFAIQMVRPVYNSDYKTPVFSYVDKDFAFIYEQYQPIQFSRGVFNDNLSSMLAFYAYYLIALDYDTFSALGGENYYLIAQDIINAIPQSVSGAFKGWKPSDGNRTRYFLLENSLNPGMKAVRQGFYEYYRKGLDLMSQNPETGREGLMKCLEYCDATNRSYPNSSAVQIFCTTKGDEIINIFKAADAAQRAKVIQYMTRMDPANTNKYVQLSY